MTEKEMRRLSRAELLELLLVQTKETERIRKKLDKAEAELADRRLRVEKAGDLAHAVLEINDVMASAQEAAQQYLDNIARMEAETKERCQAILEKARQAVRQILESRDPSSDKPDQALIREIYELIE